MATTADRHLPDPPPVRTHTRHPMVAVVAIMGAVIALCLILAWISML